MKKYLAFTILIFTISIGFSQGGVAINDDGTLPEPSAMLDIVSTDRGLLIPRVSLTSITDITTVPSPATSLLVYNIATAGVSPNNVVPGFYYFDGSKWVILGAQNTSSDAWLLTGNAGTTVGTNFIGTTDANDFAIYTNNVERIRVNQDGNVGIGITNPDEKLVIGNGVIKLSDADNVGTASDIFMKTGGVISAESSLYINADADGNSSGHIRFGSGAATSGATQHMIIRNDGNVGIGTGGPDEKLHVEGTIEVDQKVQANDNGGLELATDEGTTRIFIQDDGNVGIATMAPGKLLDVDGSTYVQDTIFIRNAIRFHPANNVAQQPDIWMKQQGLIVSEGNTFLVSDGVNDGTGDIIFGSGSEVTGAALNEHMRIVASNGRVGIGTATPTALLCVNGDIRYGTKLGACSDKRYKKQITPLNNAFEKLVCRGGVNYYWKKNKFPEWNFDDEKQIGFIAQELELIYPELVNTAEDGYKSVDYTKLTPILVEAIKEQQEIIENLKADKTAQKIEINDLKANYQTKADKGEVTKLKDELIELRTIINQSSKN